MTKKTVSSMTVEQLVKFIGANVRDVKEQDANLFERISYTDKCMKKDKKSVKKADLILLAKDIVTLLGDAVHDLAGEPVKAPAVAAENSTKPKLAASKKSEKVSDTTTEGKTSESKAEPKTPAKQEAPKSEGKKSAPKESKALDIVTSAAFPNTIKVGDAEYELAHDIKTIGDLLKAFNDEDEIVFAFYWSKRLLKQFNYASGTLPVPKNGFDKNLDLASTLYVSDDGRVCYNLSMYTEALYQVMPDDFEEVEGVRYSSGIEYQIYRATGADSED